MRLLALVLLSGAPVVHSNTCSIGYVYDVTGVPASTNLPDASSCQASCSSNELCAWMEDLRS